MASFQETPHGKKLKTPLETQFKRVSISLLYPRVPLARERVLHCQVLTRLLIATAKSTFSAACRVKCCRELHCQELVHVGLGTRCSLQEFRTLLVGVPGKVGEEDYSSAMSFYASHKKVAKKGKNSTAAAKDACNIVEQHRVRLDHCLLNMQNSIVVDAVHLFASDFYFRRCDEFEGKEVCTDV